MTLAAQKKKWLDERVAELRDSGLTDAAIARRLSITPSWFNEAIHKETVGDPLIDNLCKTFGFRFTLDGSSGDNRTPVSASIDPALVEAIREVVQQGKRNNNVMDLLVEEIRSLREQVRTLKGQPSP